jgi:hypothetical protein
MNAAGRLPLLSRELHREPGENVNSSRSGLSLWITRAAALAVPRTRLTTGNDEAPNAMPDPDTPDLFAAEGIVLEDNPDLDSGLASKPSARPKRQRKPRPPTPAERAAADRLEGGRRSRGPASPGQRARVGAPRSLQLAPVLAFPLARNASALAEMIRRLPQDAPDNLDAACDQEVRKLENRLVRKGISKQSARRCAMDLLHEAYMKSVCNSKKVT